MSQKNILIIVAVIILALVVIKVIGALSRKPVLTAEQKELPVKTIPLMCQAITST